MHRAALGFATTAADYEHARPSYPPAAVDDIVAGLSLGPGRTVIDLAAGTGKLTRLLAPSGARLVAVEPLAEMRAELSRVLPDVEALDGTAEAIPWPDGAADAVTAGQAFHWFDGERALAEIHRVLRPGGGLAMVWNVRDRIVEWVERIAEITEPLANPGVPATQAAPRYRTGEWRRAFGTTDRFTPLEHRRYAYEHEVDADTMVGRIGSISWIASLPDDQRADVLARVRAVFDGMPDRFPVPYHTELWWCRAR